MSERALHRQWPSFLLVFSATWLLRVSISTGNTEHRLTFPHRSAPTRDLAQLYSATDVLLPLIAPYTLTLMKSTNNALHLAADKGTTDTARIRELLDTWWKLNAGRAALTGLATLLAIWASAQPTTILAPFKS